jgi:monovalent cation:H+ antiporter-2, CPA2 family
VSQVQHEPWLKDLFVFLAVAGLIVPLFHRARIGTVLSFLVAGVAVGPYGLGLLADEHPWIRYLTIEDRARVDPFAELGVMFLLFMLGLEFSLPRLWSLRRYVLGLGASQFMLSALAIAAAVAITGYGAPAAIVLGVALAMSSTAIVMQLLEEQGRTGTPVGRTALSVLLFQDLMVAPVLLLTGVLGRGGESILLALGFATLQAVAAIAVIIGAGRFVLRPLLRFTAKTGSRELIMAITVLIVVGVAGATGLAGLSAALGAFLAGLLLGETEYRHQIEVDLEPFKGLLLGLFFITVGMTIDVRAVWAEAPWLLLTVAGLLLVKGAILLAAGRVFALPIAVAAEIALLAPQAGEFAFVVIGLGRANGLLPPDLAQFALALVGLTMILTPLLARAARRVGRSLQHIDHRERLPDEGTAALEDHVVIGGFGRVGQTIARQLEAENIPYIALDTNGELVTRERKAGRMVYFGDASRREFLERAGAARARAFVVTLDDPGAAERMVSAVRELKPDALVFARATDPTHAARLVKLGAVDVIPEAVESSLQLAGRVLEGLGLPEEAVVQRVSRAREEELGRLNLTPY